MFNFLNRNKIVEKSLNCVDIVENFKHVEPLMEYFKKETGIDFENKKEIIRTKLINFSKNRGFFDFGSVLSNVKNDRYLKQELIDYLTVNETYFFREMYQINLLVQKIKNSDKKVEILCAPSSSGEEPYTIAMSLLENSINKNQFKIVAIDINSDVIKEAKKAIYRQRSLHKVPLDIKQRYFLKKDDMYHLSDEIKNLVELKVLNIFDENIPKLGKFDYIFSRNMLIYFDKETKLKAKNILEGLLKNSDTPIFFGHAD